MYACGRIIIWYEEEGREQRPFERGVQSSANVMGSFRCNGMWSEYLDRIAYMWVLARVLGVARWVLGQENAVSRALHLDQYSDENSGRQSHTHGMVKCLYTDRGCTPEVCM